MELRDDAPDAHLRAREDLVNDRHWEARDRLTGFLANHPTDQSTLEFLGELCFLQRDLPAAGRYWYLTSRDDESARAARSALEERCGNRAANIISVVKPRAPIHEWPPPVQQRLRALQAEAHREGFRWDPAAEDAPSTEVPAGWRARLEEGAILSLFFVLLIGVWAVGLVTLVVLFWRWVT
jgi:hypothetical protein